MICDMAISPHLATASPDYVSWFERWRDERNRVKQGVNFSVFVADDDLGITFGTIYQKRFGAAMERAMTGFTGVARLEAAVDVVAKFVEDQPPGRQLDLEPGFAYEQMARALSMITEALVVVLGHCAHEDGPDAAASVNGLAGAIARIALSHYIFPDADPAAVRRQIRAAAGLPDGRASRSGLQHRRTR